MRGLDHVFACHEQYIQKTFMVFKIFFAWGFQQHVTAPAQCKEKLDYYIFWALNLPWGLVYCSSA